MNRKNLSNITDEEFLYVYKNAKSAAEISRAFNVSDSTITRRIEEMGLEKFYKGSRSISDEEFLRAYNSANSVKELENKLGISETSIRRRIDKLGLDRLYGSWNNSEFSDEYFRYICQNSQSMAQASQKLNMPFTTFVRRAKRLGCYVTNQPGKGIEKEYEPKYEAKSDYFSIWTPQMAYWVGFLVADGSILTDRKHTLRIILAERDDIALKMFKKHLCFNGSIAYYIATSDGGKEYPACSITINNKQIIEDLRKLGLSERKSYKHGIKYIENIPAKFVKYFCVGFFDGDGSIPVPKKKASGEISVSGDLDNCVSIFKGLGYNEDDFAIRYKGNYIILRLRTRRNFVKFYKVYIECSKDIFVLPRKKKSIEYFYKKYDYIVKDIDEKGDWLKFD